MSGLRTRLRCGKQLPKRKKKFCSDNCKFWYHQAKKQESGEDYKPYSKAQNLRMLRAGRAQRAGRIGVRYN